jgi:two-component system response regulator DesR
MKSMPLKVLVVEDMHGVRDVFVEGIKMFFPDAVVDEAVDGIDAQRKIQQSAYHVILSDLEMPNLKGDDLLEWVRSSPHHKDVPFIMVTSNTDRSQKARILELGASAYVTKPLTIQDLSQHIANVIPPHFSDNLSLSD